ncbi:hypothetical protein SRRS_49080 [Sporomusa rhizae]|uniref:4Fe-4S ferredoxin n=1 Tax=Sporomusa rhizae TaxID=357999 RepID=UPI00352A4B0E
MINLIIAETVELHEGYKLAAARLLSISLKRDYSGFNPRCNTKVACCEACFYSTVSPAYEWPRTVRSAFSDPTVEHRDTKVAGRGTEEIKTNEITGRIKRGFVGISCEMGRPSVGARFYDIEKIAVALARLGVEFEPNNPCTRLMTDPKTGFFKDEVKQEKVLSAIIEMLVPIEKMRSILETIRQIGKEVDCVLSVDLISILEEDHTIPTLPILPAMQWPVLPNGKMNTGLGRPLAKED